MHQRVRESLWSRHLLCSDILYVLLHSDEEGEVRAVEDNQLAHEVPLDPPSSHHRLCPDLPRCPQLELGDKRLVLGRADLLLRLCLHVRAQHQVLQVTPGSGSNAPQRQRTEQVQRIVSQEERGQEPAIGSVAETRLTRNILASVAHSWTLRVAADARSAHERVLLETHSLPKDLLPSELPRKQR